MRPPKHKKGKNQKSGADNPNRKKRNASKANRSPKNRTGSNKNGDFQFNLGDNTKPVRPEVEYQEKSVVEITPSHDALPLSTPVKDTENYAEKDNSIDGILSIKH